MSVHNVGQSCSLVIIADGFEEAETIILLSAIRQAGLCAKSVSLTHGLAAGAHGVALMPDLTLAELDRLLSRTTIKLVILPEGGQSLTRLAADPRLHQLLRQVVAQQGQIVAGPEGLRVLRAAAVLIDEAAGNGDDRQLPVLIRDPRLTPEAFVQDLVRRLTQSP